MFCNWASEYNQNPDYKTQPSSGVSFQDITEICNSISPMNSPGRAVTSARNLTYRFIRKKTGIPAGWTAKPVERDFINPRQAIRNEGSQNSFAAFRFADDVLIVCYSEPKMRAEVIPAINKFLEPRGLALSLEKTIFQYLPKDSFDFVGFTFRVKATRHPVLYNYPSDNKIAKLFKKLHKVAEKTFNVENCIIKLNAILRGWCYFYSTANSKGVFQKGNYLLWHFFWRYLYKKYSQWSIFKKGKKMKNKRQLAAFIYRTYTKQAFKQSHWFYVSSKSRKKSRYKGQDLLLFSPSSVKVSTPSIIMNRANGQEGSLSAFHPLDRSQLVSKSYYWKKSSPSINKLLTTQKGLCGACDWPLDDETNFELHHVVPIKLGGALKVSNLKLLCSACHQAVTTAIATRDLDLLGLGGVFSGPPLIRGSLRPEQRGGIYRDPPLPRNTPLRKNFEIPRANPSPKGKPFGEGKHFP